MAFSHSLGKAAPSCPPPAHFAIERLEFGGVVLNPPAGSGHKPSSAKNPAFSAKVVYASPLVRGGRVIFEFDFDCEGENNRVSEGPQPAALRALEKGTNGADLQQVVQGSMQQAASLILSCLAQCCSSLRRPSKAIVHLHN